METKTIKQNKLLLVYPNQKWLKDDLVTHWRNPPSSLCLLGAMVKDIVDVKIVDSNFYDLSENDFRAEIENYRPDYVGISVLTTEYADILDTATRIVKDVDRNIIVIAGGVHVTTRYLQVMENVNVDYACRGEGEHFLRELLLHLMGQGDMPKKGLIHRENGRVRVQEHVLVKDLTKLPWADYSLVKFEDYISQQPRYGPNRHPELPGTFIHVTRGCPIACSFCQVEKISGKIIRSRDAVDVVNELEFLNKHYGIKSITFQDDNLFLVKKTAKAIFKEMHNRNLQIKWLGGNVALFAIDEELLDLMQKSGCVGATVSIESGSKRVLREIVRKPLNLDEVPQKIALIKSRGIDITANFIIGFPGETWEEIRETIKFAETCNADYIRLFLAVPLPDTQLYKVAQKLNVLNFKDDEFTIDWRYSKIRSDEWTSQDISILRVYEWDRINFHPDRIQKVAEIWGCTVEALYEIRKKTRDALEF